MTFGRDLSALALDQRLADGEAEPGALPPFRGVEGIEDLLDHLFAHADAGIGDLDGDASMAVALGIEGAERQGPAIRHGVDRVDDQID